LMKIIPQDRWIKFSHQMIWHGRRVCFARKPNCGDCNLEELCYSKDKTINTQSKPLR
jgi:endonuclease III